jgi:hypothetical protein
MEITFRCMLAVVSGNVDGIFFFVAQLNLSRVRYYTEHLAVTDTMEWT